MKKSLLSTLSLAVALALSIPALGNAAATKTTAPAASSDTTTKTAPATTMATKPHQKSVAAKGICKPTKTHKCPVKQRKHVAKAAAPKTTY
ncbi:hypothetical protein [Mesorhizobium sp. B2-6-4]|uniref:hypothetical protein n=1 Tax=Mesorhizobium sp. B2-6-4 TaxID=2589913 RepID=UPI00112DE9EC|nr:hypothetical protein [Mesorhizobium sp. B2-6-4]TPJ52441.1 hypothetical protein FJ426_17080 [Mesorhizobium sp. B2-6-4]